MVVLDFCTYCKHFIGIKNKCIAMCEAFPDGMPRGFFGDKKECSGEIHFELKEGEKLPF